MGLLDLFLSLIGLAIGLGVPTAAYFLATRWAVDRICSSFRFLQDPRLELCCEMNHLFRDRDGRLYMWTLRDAVAFRWLSQLGSARVDAILQQRVPVRLLQYRPEFRTIVGYARAYGQVSGIARCLNCNFHETRRLAIWLLGLSADPRALTLILPHMKDRHVSVRRMAARALRRLNAYTELYRFKDDLDSQVRLIATDPHAVRHEFSSRLRRFCENAGGTPPRPLQLPYSTVYFHSPICEGNPPKSRAIIRRILEHIRELVSRH